jgi:hypothetical protein
MNGIDIQSDNNALLCRLDRNPQEVADEDSRKKGNREVPADSSDMKQWNFSYAGETMRLLLRG